VGHPVLLPLETQAHTAHLASLARQWAHVQLANHIIIQNHWNTMGRSATTKTYSTLGGRGRTKSSQGGGVKIPLPKILLPLLRFLSSDRVLPRLTGTAMNMVGGGKSGSKEVIAQAGGSISTSTLGYKKRPKQYFGSAMDTYQLNAASRVTAGVGVQTVFTLAAPFSGSDLTTIRGFYGAGSTTNKMLYSDAYTTIQLTNQDNGNALITLYDLVARKNGDEEPAACWIAGNTAGSATGVEAYYGSDPSLCQRFNEYWIIKKVTQFYLGAGQSHCHILKYTPNKAVQGEVITITPYIANLSHACMMVVVGAPYNDVTTKTQVSTGSVAIDRCIAKNLKYSWADDPNNTYNATNNLLAAFTNAENIMNENTGTAAADTQA